VPGGNLPERGTDFRVKKNATFRIDSLQVPQMTRISLLCAALAVLAGCTTYKLWTESGADQDRGLVQLSYEYRKFESPQVDERAGIETARERCKGWGYPNAQRKGEDRACLDGVEKDCSRWRVTRIYQCAR
jgi:hypothetical protein